MACQALVNKRTAKAIIIKNKYYKKYMRYKDQLWYQRYKLYRNKINSLKIQSKTLYYNKYFKEHALN